MVEVKANFKSQYGQDLTCRFCSEDDTQSHLLSCKELVDNLDTSKVAYSDIFKDLKNQEEMARIYTQILKVRSLKLKILEKISPCESQVHC